MNISKKMKSRYIIKPIRIYYKNNKLRINDFLYHNSFGMQRCVGITKDGYALLELENPAFKVNPENVELYRLYLCDKDINVGDWLTYQATGQEIYVDEEILRMVKAGKLEQDFKLLWQVPGGLSQINIDDEFDEIPF